MFFNKLTESKKVIAIIPAYNEEENIGRVLSMLRHVSLLDRILVVNDGSEDETGAVVNHAKSKDSRLSLLNLPQNRGKGKAMLTGAEASTSNIILFLDADLKGVQPNHVENLIRPVQEQECSMTVGLFEDGRWKTSITHKLFPFLSGQRCLYWPLFQDIYKEEINGWSIETALNLHAKMKAYKVNYVMWPGVTHATRAEKRSRITGYWSHVKMWWQIARYTYFFFQHHKQADDFPTPSATYRTQWE